MSFAPSFDAKERVRQAVDIVDLVGGYVQLRREGRGYKALCPWHDDSRPSLQINPERQSFKCWVCDIGGDIFSFLMKMEGVEFPEALAMLAERAGITLEKSPRAASDTDDKRALYQAMDWATGQYHRILRHDSRGQAARDYLAGRGITNESIEKFALGASPTDWEWIVQTAASSPHSLAALEKIGIVAQRANGQGRYDRFRGRVLFPICDAQGRPVGLGGRVLPGPEADKAAKYINSPETPLFSKSNLLYGLHHAREAIRKTGTALVMEGYTDVVMAHQFGVDNAVAVLGTALGSAHIRLLRRFAEHLRVVLVLDGDEAGRRRAGEVLQLFVAENADVGVLTLPDEQDPCDFLLTHGADALHGLAQRAPDALTHAIDQKTVGIDLQRETHRATEVLEELLRVVAAAPRLRDDTTTDLRLREQAILSRLARSFGLAEEQLWRRIGQLRDSAGASRSGGTSPRRGTSERSAEQNRGEKGPSITPLERELLELGLAAPHILQQVAETVNPSQLLSPLARKIYTRWLNLAASGVSVDFARLLLEFDEPEVKNLLVELDEQSRLKNSGEFDTRLQDVLANFRHRQRAEEVQAHTALLKDEQLPDAEGLALLLKIQQQEKSRLGHSRPTDG